MLMEATMKVTGNLTSDAAKVFSLMPMAPHTQEYGKMINKTGLGKKSGQMGRYLKENIKTEIKKDKENSNGSMGAHITAIFIITIFTVKELISGKIVNTQENGKTIECMAAVYLHGTMEKNTKETTKMGKKKALVSLNGLTVSLMKEAGPVINSTEKEFL